MVSLVVQLETAVPTPQIIGAYGNEQRVILKGLDIVGSLISSEDRI